MPLNTVSLAWFRCEQVSPAQWMDGCFTPLLCSVIVLFCQVCVSRGTLVALGDLGCCFEQKVVSEPQSWRGRTTAATTDKDSLTHSARVTLTNTVWSLCTSLAPIDGVKVILFLRRHAVCSSAPNICVQIGDIQIKIKRWRGGRMGEHD